MERPKCRECDRRLRPVYHYTYRTGEMGYEDRRLVGYGYRDDVTGVTNLFCSLRCGYRYAVKGIA